MFETYVNQHLAQQRATQIAREAELMRRRSERSGTIGAQRPTASVRTGLIATLAQAVRRPRIALGH